MTMMQKEHRDGIFSYYNADIHNAAFALPSFMKKALKDCPNLKN